MFWKFTNFFIKRKYRKFLIIGNSNFLSAPDNESENYRVSTLQELNSLSFNKNEIDCISLYIDKNTSKNEELFYKSLVFLKSDGMIIAHVKNSFFLSGNKIKFLKSLVEEREDFFLKEFFLLSPNSENSILFPVSSHQETKNYFFHLQELKFRNKKAHFKFYLLRCLHFFRLTHLFLKDKLLVIYKGSFSKISHNQNVSTQTLLTRKDHNFTVVPSNRKNIVSVFSEKGLLKSFCKFYYGVMSKEIFNTELKMIENLSKYEFETAVTPRVISYKTDLHESFLEIAPHSDFEVFSRMEKEHLNWLIELCEKTSKSTLFKESNFYSEMEEKLDIIKFYFKNEAGYWLDKLYTETLSEIYDMEFPFCFVQREFPFYHVHKLKKTNKLFVFDWEFGRTNYPPAFDLFHCMLSDSYLSDINRVKFYESVFKVLFIEKKSKDGMKSYAENLNFPSKSIYPLFVMYLIDQLSCFLPFSKDLLELSKHLDVLSKFESERQFSLKNWSEKFLK